MKSDFISLKFNSIEDIDKLIEAIEQIPENPNKQNQFMTDELSRRQKMLQELRSLKKEAEEVQRQEELKKEAEAVKKENDAIEKAFNRAVSKN